MQSERRKTLRELRQAASRELAAMSPDLRSAQLDTDVLLQHVLGLTRTELLTRSEMEVPEMEEAELRSLLLRRAKYEPVAYLTGRKEFFGRNFKVTSAVLIPRPETELLVERAEERGRQLLSANPGKRLLIVDVGVGSGAILLSLLKAFEGGGEGKVSGIGIDISEAALRIAEENRRELQVSLPVQLLHGDLLEPYLRGCAPDAETIVLLVANPPYIGRNEVLMPDVGKYEPELALFGGTEGHELPEKLLREAFGAHAGRFAAMLMEIGQGQADRLVSLPVLQEQQPALQCTLYRDLSGVERVLEILTLTAESEVKTWDSIV